MVKICGITRLEDAHLAWRAGANAIGVNFWPRSRRCVDKDLAAKIAGHTPGVRDRCRRLRQCRPRGDFGVHPRLQPHCGSAPRRRGRRILRRFRRPGDQGTASSRQRGHRTGEAIRREGPDDPARRRFGGGIRRIRCSFFMEPREAAQQFQRGGPNRGWSDAGQRRDGDSRRRPRRRRRGCGVERAPGVKDETLIAAFVASRA